MDIYSEIFLDRWIEYSGGSRPDLNHIRFEEQDDTILFHVRYVFDWNTKEIVHFTKTISKDDFEELTENLKKLGYAKLDREDKTSKLLFEWRIVEDRIQIRFELSNLNSLDGPGTYLLSEFRDLLLDETSM